MNENFKKTNYLVITSSRIGSTGIRNQDKYKNHTAKELGKKYVGFYTDGKNGKK